MKRVIAVETEDIDSCTETEILIENAPRRMFDHKMETSPSVSVTSEDVARQIRAVTDALSEHLAHLCESMREFKNEQLDRRHEETGSSRTASSSSGRDSRSIAVHQSIAELFKPKKRNEQMQTRLHVALNAVIELTILAK